MKLLCIHGKDPIKYQEIFGGQIHSLVSRKNSTGCRPALTITQLISNRSFANLVKGHEHSIIHEWQQ